MLMNENWPQWHYVTPSWVARSKTPSFGTPEAQLPQLRCVAVSLEPALQQATLIDSPVEERSVIRSMRVSENLMKRKKMKKKKNENKMNSAMGVTQ